MKIRFFLALAPFLLVSVLPAQEATAVAATPALAGDVGAARTALTSIVRVNATRQAYNLTQPWDKLAPDERRGLGAVLEGGKVLVTGEIVANATYIELEMPDDGRKATAEVIAVDYEANLALLKPAEGAKDFLAGLLPLDIATDVKPGDNLDIWQFEANGTPVSTPVVVSKGDTGGSFLPDYQFLNYEAAGPLRYRAGSFTLPVVKDGKLAGLLISYSSKEQISRMLPGPVIQHFLRDQADGAYEGFPTLGISFAQTLDEQFRKYLGLGDNEGGVYVTEVTKGSSADTSGLKVGDVILEIGGNAIDQRGNYVDPVFGKLSMSNLVRGEASVGDKIVFKVQREGKKSDIEVTLTRREPEDYLVDPYMFDRGPRYQILGGLVFQELTRPFLQLYGDKWESRAPIKYIQALSYPEEFEKAGRRKLVVLMRVVPTPATLGYERLNSLIVTKVNNREINDIKDLDEAIKHPIDGIHRVEFDEFPKLIFLDAATTSAIDAQIGQRFGETKRLE